MRLLALTQTSPDPKDIIFRYRPFWGAISTVICASLLAWDVWGAFHVRKTGIPPTPDNGERFVLIVLGLFLLLAFYLAQHTWRASLHPSNWLLRIRGNKVLIKFRSFENWELSDADLQIIELDREEIASVRRMVRQIESPGLGGSGSRSQTQTQVLLEVSLQNVDVATIDAALQAERPRRVSQGSRTTALNYPVVLENGFLRIDWAAISPGVKRALIELSKLVPVEKEAKTVSKFTLTALQTLSADEQRKRIKELAAQDPIAAIRTTRELYGCSLAEAKQFVES